MQIKTKVVKFGSGYAMAVPKALIDCGVLNYQEEVLLDVKRLKPEGEKMRGMSFDHAYAAPNTSSMTSERACGVMA